MRLICAVLLLSLVLGTPAAPAAPALGAGATRNVALPPGKWKSIRVHNVPNDTIVSIAVQSSGKVGLNLLSEADFRAFPDVKEPLLAARVDSRLSFTITLTNAGDYYVVFDNRGATDERTVKFAIRANRVGSAAGTTGPGRDKPNGGGAQRAPDKM